VAAPEGRRLYHDVSLQKRLAAHNGEAAAAGGAAMDQASRLLARLQDEVAAEGFTLAFVEAMPEEGRMPLILLPTAEKYAALLAAGTNGINQGHDAEAVIRWLMDMERENPFRLGGCGLISYRRFAGPVKGRGARPAHDRFCPDWPTGPYRSAGFRAGLARAIADGWTTGRFDSVGLRRRRGETLSLTAG
jgi:hypothetical protein